MVIKPALSRSEIALIVKMANEIIPEFYADKVPREYNLYFVKKYQSFGAINEQIKAGFEYYLIQKENLICGYFAIQPKDQNLTISKLYLLKNHRGSGLGKIALDFIIQRTKDLNLDTIKLTVNSKNESAISLYLKYGFLITRNLHVRVSKKTTVLDYEMTKVF